MTRILLSYYKIQEINKSKVNVFWDGLIKSLVDCGNEVYVINTAYFNKYETNVIMDTEINELVLSKITQFDPELIITFNHRIPYCILESFKNVETLIWDGDELRYFCDLPYIKKHISRYKLLSIVKGWRQNYLDFGFKKEQLNYVLPATSVISSDIEKTMNVSFLGSIHYFSDKLSRFINFNNDNIQLKFLLEKYFGCKNYEDYSQFYSVLKNYQELTNFDGTDLYHFLDNRLLVLVALLDLGLTICGDRWELSSFLLPQLAVMYDKKSVWNLEENNNFYNSSIISISPIHPQAQRRGFPWRTFDIMASSACLVSEYSSDLKELTKNFVDVPMFNTPYEARDLCKYLLEHPSERKEIVDASNQYINANCRWINRFKEIEEITGIKIINNIKRGKASFLSEEMNLKQKIISRRNALKFTDKLRYKIWKHYSKILKKKGII